MNKKFQTPAMIFVVALLAGFEGTPFAHAQGTTGFSPPEKATLMAQVDQPAYAPGETVELELLVEVEDGWHVNSRHPTYDYLIPTTAEIQLPSGWQQPLLTYPDGVMKTFAFEDEPLSVYDGQFVIGAEAAVPENAPSGSVLVGVSLRYQACDDRSCLAPVTARTEVGFDVKGEVMAGGGSEAKAGNERRTGSTKSLVGFVLFGLLGGLLLNAMPCVLPILSLKLLGLVKSSTQTRKAVVAGSLATTSGILVSFWALAAAAILAKSVGATVGWGIQFQQPVFVTALAFVVTLFCLNLWGLFEVPLPQRVAGWAEAAGGEGLPAHFTAGLFATLMATPCSAPFLGTAIGFALAQTGFVIVVIFTAVGLGMASPYILLAAAPGAVRLLPKPGIWMENFRKIMGYMLAAAAVWLLYVLSSQVSRERLAFVEIALLMLALFLWIRHQSGGTGWWHRLGIAGAIATITVGIAIAAGAGTGEQASASSKSNTIEKLIPWVTFDRVEAERLAAQGTLVFVDVTADWCFTCKVNERLVLETEEIESAFARFGVVPMKADWTNRDDDIAAFLADHGKYGIPFYLLYRPGREPLLLGELLTKEKLLSALEETAAAEASAR